MTAPLISVVIPNYNYAEFLPDAVRSVAQQTWPCVELVVVDDCSQDDSIPVLESLRSELAEKFQGGFRIERSPRNMGAHAALNRGIQTCSGRYAAILNADDKYQPNRLEAMHNALCSTGARLAFSDVQCIDGDGSFLSGEFADRMRALPHRPAGYAFMALAAIAENVAVSTGNMLLETSLHAELGGFRPYRYVHDYDFLFRACLAGEPIHVPETTYLYRLHGNNTFTRLQDIGIAENRLVWLEMYARIKAGDVDNETMLAFPEYRAMCRDAARAYGVQKRIMWSIAGTPLGLATAAAMRQRITRDSRRRQQRETEYAT